MAKITAPELPKDVPGAEAVISRHKEYKTEVDARTDSFDNFSAAGNALIDQGHFMAEEIADKIATLEARRKLLLETWQKRALIYERNHDLRVNFAGIFIITVVHFLCILQCFTLNCQLLLLPVENKSFTLIFVNTFAVLYCSAVSHADYIFSAILTRHSCI